MKANRKFMKGDDEAVSPVIAVILMVAITVVLAATVYVWVSGFGAQGSAPAKTLSLTSNGAIGSDSFKNYTVSSATPGMRWSDVTITLNGEELDYNDSTAIASGAEDFCVILSGNTCATSAEWDGGDHVISAGHSLTIKAADISGQTLRVLDSQANSVVLTLTVG